MCVAFSTSTAIGGACAGNRRGAAVRSFGLVDSDGKLDSPRPILITCVLSLRDACLALRLTRRLKLEEEESSSEQQSWFAFAVRALLLLTRHCHVSPSGPAPARVGLLLNSRIQTLSPVYRFPRAEQSSKRQTLKQKYTIQKLAKEHRRKQKKIAVKLGRPASTGSASP